MPAQPSPAIKFDQLPGIYCDCSVVTLRMAIHELGPSHLYTLAVTPREFLSACNMVREATDAELAIQINVEPDESLQGWAWYLSANGRRVGSYGAGG